MGGRGSKNTSTSHTTRPARRDSSPIRPDVVPVEPTPSQPDTKRPGTSFKGVVSFRDGPAAVKFEALGSRDTLQFISDTEVRNQQYSFNTARGNVRVKAGKWYYEVTIQTTGTIWIGWCSKDFKGQSGHALGSDAHSWAFSGNNNGSCTAMTNGVEIPFGKQWKAGSVIGVTLDCQKREIEYFLDGEALGVAFGGIAIPAKGMYPAVCVDGSQRIKGNFGQTAFKYPRPGFYAIHSNLGPSGLAKLEKIFEKYKELGVAGGDKADVDILQPDGLGKFMASQGLDMDGVDIMILEWKLGVKTPYEVSRFEFLAGFDQLQCEDEAAVGRFVRKQKQQFDSNEDSFRDFYMWAFDFFKEKPTAKSMGPETASATWATMLDGRFGLLNEWLAYFDENVKSGVNKDFWKMLLKFSRTYNKPADLARFDENDAWPLALIEFVANMNEKKAGTA